jgi:hypothetical protein
MMGANVSEECVNGGQSHIPRGYAVFSFLFQIDKERKDAIWLDIFHIQIANIPVVVRSDKSKEQDHTVSIAVNRVSAHSAKPRKVVSEVIPQAAGQ